MLLFRVILSMIDITIFVPGPIASFRIKLKFAFGLDAVPNASIDMALTQA